MNSPHKILFLEDTPLDADLILHELKKANINFVSRRVETRKEFLAEIRDFLPDIILSDYSLPSFNGVEAFRLLKELKMQMPFILVTANISEQLAIDCLNEGVDDFILKSSLGRVPKAIKNAIEKKQAERKIQAAEWRLKESQRIAHLGSWELDFATKVAVWSEEACRIYGLLPQESQQSFEAWLSFIHPLDLDFVKNEIEMSHIALTDASFSHRIIDKNGDVKYVHSKSRFEFNAEGKPIGLHGIVQDETEKKIAEQQKEFDRTNLYALINNTNDLMWSVDKEFKLITSNQRFDDLIKLMSGGSIKKGHNVLATGFSEEQLKRWKSFYERAFAGETFTEIEYANAPVEFWTEISFYPIKKKEKIIGTACYSRDITERKKAEEKINASELRYQSLIEQASDAILIADECGHLKDLNASASNLLGYSKEEILKLKIKDLTFKKDILSNPLRLDEIRSGEVVRNERRLKRKNGSAVEVDISSKMILDGRMLIFIRDISELKKMERAIFLSEMVGQEKERKRLSRELHDGIGQILVASTLQLTSAKRLIDKKEFDTLSDKLTEIGSLLKNTIREVRDISHNMSPHLLEELGLASAMQYICETIAKTSNIAISFRSNLQKKIGESLELILYRTFQELTANIIKHSQSTQATIQLLEGEKEIYMRVEDNGIGLNEHTGETKHSGMGLASIKNRVLLLNGSLKIIGIPGKGTKIEVRIPLPPV